MSTPKYEYLSHNDMDGYYADICRAMAGAQYRPDVIIAISRGGLDMGVKLSNYFENTVLVPLVWHTRDGSFQDTIGLQKALYESKGLNVLIVDDILDSGETLFQIEKVCEEFSDDVAIDYAVAIENQDIGFDPSWSGRIISRQDEPQWFVFPWENWWKKG